MRLTIEGKHIDLNKIKIIAIDGLNSALAMAGGFARYYITFRGDNDFEYNSNIGGSFEKTKSLVHGIHEILRDHGVRNFVCLNDRYIINLDKVEGYNWQHNLLGQQVIWAEFYDGSQYAVYSGQSEKYAEKLYTALSEVQETYVNDKKTDEVVGTV